MMRRAHALVLVLLASLVAADDNADPAITAAELHAHVKLLASDAWEGRGTGSQGEREATDYIAAHFKRLGCEPAGEGGTYFQTVRVPSGMKIGPKTAFEVLADDPLALKVDEEFRPFGFTAAGWSKGDVVFAGYGITAPDLGYDDYAGTDVEGKVVFIFRHLPHGPAWRGPALRRYATFQAKVANLAKRGAVGLVIMNNPHNFPPAPPAGADARPGRGRRRDVAVRGGGGAAGTMPAMHVTLKAAKRLTPVLFGATPEELEQAIHAGAKPAPASRPGKVRVRIHADIEHTYVVGRNVCALLKAGAPGAGTEVVVMGAHHDHVGKSGMGSLARGPRRREIHNGADDNASGTSGILEVAEHLASKRNTLKRSILFLTFTAEERGLVGSRYFVNHPTVPLERMVAMINMDMIGRLEGRRLFVGGVKTSPMFRPMLERIVSTVAGLEVEYGDGGRAPSDNTSFYNKKMPVLFFYSGDHRDYHRPTDDADKIDSAGMVKAARLAAATAEALATNGTRPVFQRADRGGMPKRARIGIRTADGKGGVSIVFLQPRGAAAGAGLKRGDVILAMNDTKTPNTPALTDFMRKCKPGQKIVVKIRRGDATESVEVVLGGG